MAGKNSADPTYYECAMCKMRRNDCIFTHGKHVCGYCFSKAKRQGRKGWGR